VLKQARSDRAVFPPAGGFSEQYPGQRRERIQRERHPACSTELILILILNQATLPKFW